MVLLLWNNIHTKLYNWKAISPFLSDQVRDITLYVYSESDSDEDDKADEETDISVHGYEESHYCDDDEDDDNYADDTWIAAETLEQGIHLYIMYFTLWLW